ncbi:MAG: F0F1 ATP synthase subunit delta [Candidatus Saccharimonadales bacterium]
MKVARTKLASVIANMLGSSKSEKSVAEETAAYLLAENRVGDLESLLRDIQQLRVENGVVEVTTVSAFKLNELALAEVKNHIKALYPAAKNIIINQELDESALAGVKLELANQQLDLTARGKLNQFKQLTGVGD